MNSIEREETKIETFLLWLPGIIGAGLLIDAFLLSRSIGIWLGL